MLLLGSLMGGLRHWFALMWVALMLVCIDDWFALMAVCNDDWFAFMLVCIDDLFAIVEENMKIYSRVYF